MEKPAKVVTVRAFGARLLGGQAAQDLASEVFRAQNRLWNALVEIERGAREAYRAALVQSDTELADLQDRADAEQTTIDALIDSRNRARAAKRSKTVDKATDYAQGIKDATARLKELRARMKEVKVRAKEAARPLIEAAELQRREKVKGAVAAADMWWAHSETVLLKFDVARVRAMKEGRDLRFHRYDGEGSMGVRFSVEGGSLAKIYGGSTSMLHIRDPLPEELGAMKAVKADGNRRVIVELRAGGKVEVGDVAKLRFLVTMHGGRELPTDAPLKTVTVTRRMHVNKPEWQIVFTFSRGATPEDAAGANLPSKAVGIDLGFRLVRDNDGNKALRVGSVNDGNKVRYITLDHDWLGRMDRADRLRSDLDRVSNIFWESIKPQLDSDVLKSMEDDQWLKVVAGRVRRAKGAYYGLLVALCDAHKAAGEPLGEAVAQEMHDYKREATRLALQAHHTRRKAVDHRKHLYRNAAAQIVREAGLIGIVDTDFRTIAATVTADGNDTELAQAARRYRTWAAPSELRLAIEQAGKREKVELADVPAKNNTRTCSACGHVHQDAIEDLTFVCAGCGKVWDQDENSSANCRKFALEYSESSGRSTT